MYVTEMIACTNCFLSRLSITSIEDQGVLAKESSYYHIHIELVFLAILFFQHMPIVKNLRVKLWT
jgi:hypothetical protein